MDIENIDRSISEFSSNLQRINELLRKLTVLSENMSVSSSQLTAMYNTIEGINQSLASNLGNARQEILDKNQLFTNQIENIINNLYNRIEEFEDVFTRSLMESFAKQLNALHDVVTADIGKMRKRVFANGRMMQIVALSSISTTVLVILMFFFR